MEENSVDSRGGGKVKAAESGRSPKRRVVKTEFSIKTTRPEVLRRHNISDEELEMLAQDSADGLTEMFWGLCGGAIAALPSAGEALWNAFLEIPPVPLTLLHLIEVAIVLMGASCSVVIKVVSRGRASRVEKLVKDIRARGVG